MDSLENLHKKREKKRGRAKINENETLEKSKNEGKLPDAEGAEEKKLT